jgi:hypothetical protein
MQAVTTIGFDMAKSVFSNSRGPTPTQIAFAAGPLLGIIQRPRPWLTET